MGRRRSRVLLVPLLIAFGPAATGFREPVTWPAPSLGAGVKTINVPVQGGDFSGNPSNADCLVRMPTQPVTGSVKVGGCRNVSLVGGEFRNDGDPCGAPAAYDRESAALYLTGFTGTAHVEGLRIHGHGFSDGLWMSSTEPNSVGQVEASWFGGFAACAEPLTGAVAGWPKEHPDCFQTWAGPNVLRFDKVTCFTIYEGLNLDTNNWADSAGRRYPARLIDIRRTNVHLDERTPNGRQCFTAWNVFSPAPTRLDRAYCTTGNAPFEPVAPSVPSNPSWWSAVTFGRPPRGDETTYTEAGIGYRHYVTPGPSGSAPRPGAGTPDEGAGSAGGTAVLPGGPFQLRRALQHGLFSHVRCVRYCRAAARFTLGRRGARRFGLGKSSTVVARGTLHDHRPGRHRFTIRFTSRARAHLRRARRLELSVSVSIRERGTKRRMLGRRIVLVRRGR